MYQISVFSLYLICSHIYFNNVTKMFISSIMLSQQAESSYDSPCSYQQKARVFRLTKLNCKAHSLDYKTIPEGITALNETQDWSVVDINKFYNGQDLSEQTTLTKCQFFALNDFDTETVISNAVFVIDAVIDLSNAADCQTIQIAPVWTSNVEFQNVSFVGNVYLDNVDETMSSKLQLSTLFGPITSQPKGSVGSSVQFFKISSKQQDNGRKVIQNSQSISTDKSSLGSVSVSLDETDTLGKMIEDKKIIKGGESVATDYITNLYYPAENTDKINIEIAYDINDRLVREIEDQIRDCEMFKQQQNIYTCQNYTFYIQEGGAIQLCNNQIFDYASGRCNAQCNNPSKSLRKLICIDQQDCDLYQFVLSGIGNQCAEDCPKFLGYYKSGSSKVCSKTSQYIDQSNNEVENCANVHYGQECLDKCDDDYQTVDAAKLCISPTNITCSQNNKYLLESQIVKAKCVDKCVQGLFGYYHTCTNPKTSDSQNLVNTCLKQMYISSKFNPSRYDQCHYVCDSEQIANMQNQYCVDYNPYKSICSYPTIQNKLYGICQDCSFDYVFDWGKRTCMEYDQCTYLLFNVTHYECEDSNVEEYCPLYVQDTINKQQYHCVDECPVNTIPSDYGCVTSCKESNQFKSSDGLTCVKSCLSKQLYYDNVQYQCVDETNNLCNPGVQIQGQTINNIDYYICSECAQNQIVIQDINNASLFSCQTQESCVSLLKYTASNNKVVCYQQVDTKYCKRYIEQDNENICQDACSTTLSAYGKCVESCGSELFVKDNLCVKAEECGDDQLKIYYERANFCGSTCPPAFAKDDENKQCAIKCSLLGLQNSIINLNNQSCVSQKNCKYLFVYQYQDNVCLGTPDDESINSKCDSYVAISNSQNKCLVTCEQGSIARDKQCVKSTNITECEDGKPFYTSEENNTCTECSTTYHVTAEKMYCGDCTTEEYHVKSVYGADQCMTSCPEKMFQVEQTKQCYPSYCNQYEKTFNYTSTDKCVEKCTSSANTNLITDLITLQCQDSCASGYQALLNGMYVCMNQCIYQAIFINDNNVCTNDCGNGLKPTISVIEEKLSYTCSNCNTQLYQTNPVINGNKVTVCIDSCSYSTNNTYYQLNSDSKTYTCVQDCSQTDIVIIDDNGRNECVSQCSSDLPIYQMQENHESHATYQCSDQCITAREILPNNDIHCITKCISQFLINQSKIYQYSEEQGDEIVNLCIDKCPENYYIYNNYYCSDDQSEMYIDETNTYWVKSCKVAVIKEDKQYCAKGSDCRNENMTFQYPQFNDYNVIKSYYCTEKCTFTKQFYNSYTLLDDNSKVCTKCSYDRQPIFLSNGSIQSQQCINECESTKVRVYDGMCIEPERNCNDLSQLYGRTLITEGMTCILASNCQNFIIEKAKKDGDISEFLQCSTTQECINQGYDKLSTYGNQNSCVQKCGNEKYSLQIQATQLKQCVDQCYGLLQDPTKKQLFGSEGICNDQCNSRLYQIAEDNYHFKCVVKCGNDTATEGINSQYYCVDKCPENYFYQQMNFGSGKANVCKKSCVYLYQGNECKESCTPNIYQTIEGKDTCVSSCEGETQLQLPQVVYYSSSRKLNIIQCVNDCNKYEGFYKYQFQCQRSCDNVFISANRNECVDECESSQNFYVVSESKKICVDECPEYLYTQEEGNECKSICDSKTPYLNNNNQCIDACPAGTYEIDNICANGCLEYTKFQYYNQETGINECVGSCSQFEQFVLASDSTKRCVKQSYKYYTKSSNEYYVQNQCAEGKKYDVIVYVFGMQVRRCVDQCTADYIIDNICIQSLSNCDMLGLNYYVESEKEQQCYAYCPQEKPVLDSVFSQNCIEKCSDDKTYTLDISGLKVCIASCYSIKYFVDTENNVCTKDCIYEYSSDKNENVCTTEAKCKEKVLIYDPTTLSTQCASECDLEQSYLQTNNYCVTSCPSQRYYINGDNKICTSSCKENQKYVIENDNGLEIQQCVDECPKNKPYIETDNECVGKCSSLLFYKAENLCIESTADERCDYFQNTNVGTIFCGANCSSIGNNKFIDIPENICIGSCKTQYLFTEYPQSGTYKYCTKRCNSNKYYKQSSSKYYCMQDKCNSSQVMFYGNTSHMLMQCTNQCPTNTYKHIMTTNETYCNNKCLGSLEQGKCTPLSCESKQLIKYNTEKSEYQCTETGATCDTIIFEELKWCMQDEHECLLATIKVDNGADICATRCQENQSYRHKSQKSSDFYCVDDCKQYNQITDMYNICTDKCETHNAYDYKTNKCVYKSQWCQKYIIKGNPPTCVDDCGKEYQYIDGVICSSSCKIYSFNQNQSQCVESCQTEGYYISTIQICQKDCDTEYYMQTQQGYKCVTKCPDKFIYNDASKLNYCQALCPEGLKLQAKQCVKNCDFGEDLTVIYQSSKQDVCVTKCDSDYLQVKSVNDQTVYTCQTQAQCIYMQAKQLQLNGNYFYQCVSSCNKNQLIYINQCTDNCSELLAYKFQEQSQVCAEQCYNLYISTDNTTCLVDCREDFTDNYDATCKVSCDSNIEDITVMQCLRDLSQCQWQTSLSNGTTQCTTQCSSKFFVKNTNGNQCIEKCPDDKKYLQKFVINSENFQCVEACSQTQFIQENYCVLQCDEEYQIQGQQCVKSGSQPDDSGDDNIDDEKKKSSTGAIVGGVIGAIVVVAIIVVLVIYFLKHKKNPSSKVNYGDKEMSGSNNISTAQNMI